MKHLTKAIALCCGIMLLSASSQAQSDVKVNFLGLLFNQYQFGYEHVLNEEMSVGGWISFSKWDFETTTFDINGNTITEETTYNGFSLIPNYRFYFSPDDDAEGFFVEAYMKYLNRKATGLDWSIYNEQTFTWENVEYERKENSLALGLGVGRKWVTDAGFFFETFGGLGKTLTDNTTYSEQAVEDAAAESDEFFESNIPSIDFRLQLNIGWRF